MSNNVNQSELELEVGPTVRPLQGLHSNKRGSSWDMGVGDTRKTLVDVRSRTLDAEMLTVTVGIIANESPIGIVKVDMFAHVTWGIGGANFEADIDLLNGFTFSVVANYLKVDANYSGAGPQRFQVSAGVGYGTFAQHVPAQRTIIVGTVLNTASTIILLPNFASSFTLAAITTALALPPGPVDIEFIGAAVNSRYQFKDWSNDGNLSPTTIPIPNGSRAVSFINLSGADLVISAIFSLSL